MVKPFAICCIAVCAASAVNAAEPVYDVVDLGTLGGVFTSAFGINNHGDAVGRSTLTNVPHAPFHAFLDRDGELIDLGSLPGRARSRATAINNGGEIIGFASARRNESDGHAFLYSNGRMTDLHPAVSFGGVASFATAINKHGDIAGDATTRDELEDRCFVYRRGLLRQLGNFGGTFCQAGGINNHGRTVGASTLAGDDHAHAYLDDGVTTRDLGTLGSGQDSEAFGINAADAVVGDSFITPDGPTHAFQYRNGVMTDIHAANLDRHSLAFAINRRGQVVGFSFPELVDTFPGNFAVVWNHGVPTDLNGLIPPDSGWVLYRAAAINDHGEIVGVGLHGPPGTIARAFLLIPRQEDWEDHEDPGDDQDR